MATRFFELHSMLYARNKPIKIGWRPIFMVLEYLLYGDLYTKIRDKYDDVNETFFEEAIEIVCESTTGIRMMLSNDPVGCMREMQTRGMIDVRRPYRHTEHWPPIQGYPRPLCFTETEHDGYFGSGKFNSYDGPFYCNCIPGRGKPYTVFAVQHTHIKCLRFIHEEVGCSLFYKLKRHIEDDACVRKAAIYNYITNHTQHYFDFKKKVLRNRCYKNIGLSFLKELLNNGALWDPFVAMDAAKYRNYDVLHYIFVKKLPYDRNVYKIAAQNNDLNLFHFLNLHGYRKCGRFVCVEAAKNGHVNILQYMHNKGYGISSRAFKYASMNGHIDVLRFAKRNNYSLNNDVWEFAAANNRVDVLQFAVDNDYVFNDKVWTFAARHGHIDVLRFAVSNGYKPARKYWIHVAIVNRKNQR